MSARGLYRVSAVILLLFAAGHTLGFLKFKPPSAEGLAVRDAMNNVPLQVGGQTFTYGGFYRGFGLFISIYLLFSAYLSWHLGTMAGTNPGAIGGLRWVFVAVQVACLALSWIYFFPVTVVFSAAVAVCLGWAAYLIR